LNLLDIITKNVFASMSLVEVDQTHSCLGADAGRSSWAAWNLQRISVGAVPSAFRCTIASSFARVLSTLWVSGLFGRIAVAFFAVDPSESLTTKEGFNAFELAGC
jgi:hypothetical protein